MENKCGSPRKRKEYVTRAEHAQGIYLEAYNSAWDQYDEPEERRGAN